jgi:hypothetical protein
MPTAASASLVAQRLLQMHPRYVARFFAREVTSNPPIESMQGQT